MEIFDCWIYILNNMEHLKEIPFLDKYPVFRKLAAIGDLQKLTPEERDYYEEDVKVMRDLYATDKWEKEKRRMAREKAWSEGRTEGRAEGRAEGRLEERRQNAKKMKELSVPVETISQVTGLSVDEIDSL